MKITILSMGSRGDVQPMVALGRGLIQSGHEVILTGKDNYEDFVKGHGVPYVPFLLGGEKQNEIKEVMETGRNFFKAARKSGAILGHFFDDLFRQSVAACRGADLILYSGFAKLYGYHVGEISKAPAYPALLHPQSRTRAFPFPGFPDLGLGSAFNLFSYRLAQTIAWRVCKKKINTVRREYGLHAYRGEPPPRRMHREKTPFLFGFSPTLVPKPEDWHDNLHITGYWFLGRPEPWSPPRDLVDFLEAGPAPIYFGFGSMSSRDPERETQIVHEALRRTGQRGVILTGWGLIRRENPPDYIFQTDAIPHDHSIPHDWLFPRVAAVVHHCGAGTTASGLLAGKPTISVPYFGDQPFWAKRIYGLGVGTRPVSRNKLTVDRLVRCIEAATKDETLIMRAARIGKQIGEEDGVANAVRIVNRL